MFHDTVGMHHFSFFHFLLLRPLINVFTALNWHKTHIWFSSLVCDLSFYSLSPVWGQGWVTNPWLPAMSCSPCRAFAFVTTQPHCWWRECAERVRTSECRARACANMCKVYGCAHKCVLLNNTVREQHSLFLTWAASSDLGHIPWGLCGLFAVKLFRVWLSAQPPGQRSPAWPPS